MYAGSRRGSGPRHRLRTAAAAALLGVLVVLPATATAAAARHPEPDRAPLSEADRMVQPSRGTDDRTADDTSEPLDVELTSLSPSVVPKKGPIHLTGIVRNDSQETWQDINVHTWVSTTPLTTTAELATATATPADADVGERLTSEHGFVAVGDLAPGEQTSFTLRVPRDELQIPDEPGVYFVGVQALGTGTEGREVAGRDRTFMSVVQGRRPRSDVALVVPFRQAVTRDTRSPSQLSDPSDWRTLLSADGRLERLLGLAESGGSAALTLLVDPAVLDAVATLAEQGDDADAARAKAWLARFDALAKRQSVLGLAYGDPDVAALARHDTGLLDAATTLSQSTFAREGIAAAAAAAPTDGSLAPRLSDQLPSDTTLLLSDSAVTSTSTATRSRSGQPILAANADVALGGPSPTPATWALAMRQRIVAEASLRRDGAADPLVVSLPSDWNPGPDWSAANFVSGLELPWLRLVPATSALVADDGSPATAVAYPASLAKLQISAAQVTAVQDVRHGARVYADALTQPGSVVDQLTKVALETGVSVHTRGHRRTALDRTHELATTVRDRLAGIRVEGFSLVTMSGGSGAFTVTLVNDLTRPVRVGLAAHTSGGLRITAPAAQLLPAGQRTTVKLRVTAGASRVRTVVLTPETPHGYAVGTPLRFSIRNTRVSSLVWGVMAGASALLLFMIVRRAVRRGGLRREGSTP